VRADGTRARPTSERASATIAKMTGCLACDLSAGRARLPGGLMFQNEG
jgi:hypothetical protein